MARANLNVAARQIAESIGMKVLSRETFYGEGPLCVHWYLRGAPEQSDVRLCLGVVANYGGLGWYGEARLENLAGVRGGCRSVMLVDPAQGLSGKASRKQAQERFFEWAQRCLAKSAEHASAPLAHA